MISGLLCSVLILVIQASSNGDYVDLCLETLVINFMPPTAPQSASYFIELLKQPRGLSKKIQVLDRVHSTLNDISNLVPLTPLRLEKIVRDRMPNIYTKEPVSSILDTFSKLVCSLWIYYYSNSLEDWNSQIEFEVQVLECALIVLLR